MTSYDKLLIARGKDRPTGLDYIKNIISDFIELHGDRRYGDDPAIVGGIGILGGTPVTVICTEKGSTTKDKIKRNFGSAHPEGYRKALRLMKQAEKFHRPVICFVDTAGAFCGIDAEERGQGQAISENLMEMITLKTPIISVITGEGGSGGALALAVADEVWMLENSAYSVISPEGCASILWKDVEMKAEAAACLGLTAETLYDLKLIDRIISEQGGDFALVMETMKSQLTAKLAELRKKEIPELTEDRYKKFRQMGVDRICWPS